MKVTSNSFESCQFWQDLTQQQQQLLHKSAQVHRIAKGEPVGMQQECTGMIFVTQGELRVYLLSEDGREVTLYRLYAGDVCVLSAACVLKEITFQVQIDASQESEIVLVGSNVVHHIWEENLKFRCFVYEKAIERFSDVMWTMQQILFMSADKRLATFLLEESSKTGTQKLELTQEQIAKYMGSAREVVSRLLKYFAQEKVVQLFRGGVTILDKEKLQQLAEK